MLFATMITVDCSFASAKDSSQDVTEEQVLYGSEIPEGYELIFDPYYYYEKYKNVISVPVPTKENLFNNFKKVGMKKGYQGCASFNVQCYKERYPDLEASFGNNYVPYYIHYIRCGAKENRDGSFDEELYNIEIEKHRNAPVEVSDDEIKNYYDKAVFVGDSVMVGYYYYASSHRNDAWVGKSDFLAQYSTAIRHAIIDVSEDPYQPSYKGEKINIWNAIPQMDVDKVFIMYGTNDLGVYNPSVTYDKYLQLIAKIRETSPNVEIHIISMTPVCAAREGKGLNNNAVNEFNQLIINGAQQNNYYYVPLNPNLIGSDGCLIPEYSTDKFVHQTTAAYIERWEPVFKEYAIRQISGTYEIPEDYSVSFID